MATKTRKTSRTQADALDEMIAEFTAGNAEFPVLLAAAERRRELLRTLGERRREKNLSQTLVAAAMRTSQPALARLETTAADAKLSTVERFAGALGYAVEYRLVPTDEAKAAVEILVKG